MNSTIRDTHLVRSLLSTVVLQGRASLSLLLVLVVVAIACMPRSHVATARAAESVERRMALAEQARLAEKWEIAARLFEEVLREVADDPQQGRLRNGCRKGLAAVYFESGRHADALRMQTEYLASLRRIPGLERRELVLAAQSAADLEAALNRPDKAAALLDDALRYEPERPLNPIVHIQSLLKLAQFESRSGREARATWLRAEQVGEAALKQIDARIVSAAYRPTIVRELAAARVACGRRAQALELLRKEIIAPKFGTEAGERISILAAFAEQLAEEKRFEEATAAMSEAIAAARRNAANDRQLGTLLINAAVIEESAGRRSAAQRHWQEVVANRERVLAEIKEGRIPRRFLESTLDETALALFRLNEAGREIEVLRELLECRKSFLGVEHPVFVRTQARLGTRCALAGDYAAARPLLVEVVQYRRTHRSVDPTGFVEALSNLGSVERQLGSYGDAGRLFDEALALHDKLPTKNESGRAELLYNIAGVHFATGRYHEAIRRYTEAGELCRTIAEMPADDEARVAAERMRSRSLLSLAMVYKSQGQLDQAGRMCLESLAVLDRNPAARAADKAPHYNALAALYSAQQRYLDALQWARKALDASGENDETTIATARHQLAYLHWLAGSFSEADALWHSALEAYRRRKQSVLVARTLNYLGVSAYRQQRLADAEKYFREAHSIYEDHQAVPQEHYSVLCNLAVILHAERSHDEALKYLREAVALTELPRTAVFGAERERAEFFARFSRAFDLLVDWQLEQGNLDQAFESVERSRNRTFLDQLDLAGVDLRSTLDENAGSLLKVERELNIELSSLRAQEQRLIPGGDDELDRLREKSAAVQRRYAEVWTEIRNASRQYRELLSRDQDLVSLHDLRKSVVDERTLLLCYYIGANRCYLFAIGHGPEDFWFYPLEITADSATSANRRPTPLPRNEALLESPALQRGLVDTVVSAKGRDADRENAQSPIKSGPIAALDLTRLIAWYREDLRDIEFGQTRGITGGIASQKGDELRASSLVLGEVLLPKSVRELIRKRAPEQIVVVPDGALHQLPFEAILLQEGATAKFVLDEFPPIAYAPSANILRKLLSRTSDKRNETELLAVGDPTYSAGAGDSLSGRFNGVDSAFKPLPGTKLECERIAAAFGSERAVLKLESLATEGEVRAAIEGKPFVHLAAHGFVREGHDNLFGAIALTSVSGRHIPEDDGFLELREIQSLKLNGCELAVLSACDTNVGPGRPLEAASTMAQAFLSAGAKRVVASHWSVADESAAELMAVFFQEIARCRRENRNVTYAQALQTARRKVRDTPRWSAPFFWSPFVLIGPSR